MERLRRRMRRRPLHAVPVVLYSRPGCHLCEEARELLDEISQQWPLDVEEIDITSDPQLVRKYDIVIPVIHIQDSVELQAPIDESTLRRAVREAAARS